MAEQETPEYSTPAYDTLPLHIKKMILNHVVERTTRLFKEKKLPADLDKKLTIDPNNTTKYMDEYLLKEIERLANNPTALEQELREEKLHNTLPATQLKQLAQSGKHGVTGGVDTRTPQAPATIQINLVAPMGSNTPKSI